MSWAVLLHAFGSRYIRPNDSQNHSEVPSEYVTGILEVVQAPTGLVCDHIDTFVDLADSIRGASFDCRPFWGRPCFGLLGFPGSAIGPKPSVWRRPLFQIPMFNHSGI